MSRRDNHWVFITQNISPIRLGLHTISLLCHFWSVGGVFFFFKQFSLSYLTADIAGPKWAVFVHKNVTTGRRRRPNYLHSGPGPGQCVHCGIKLLIILLNSLKTVTAAALIQHAAWRGRPSAIYGRVLCV